jgi:hypothetical protein
MTDFPLEFSRPVSTARLGAKPATYRIEAQSDERAALARRFDLISLDRLSADVTLVRESGGAVRLTARLAAAVAQRCVVTLAPVPADLVDDFTLIYRDDVDEAEADRVALENPEDEIVEPLIGDSIDIGEAVAQQLSVVMDPYPRALGVPSTSDEAGDGDDHDEPLARRNPFDALAPLKKQ